MVDNLDNQSIDFTNDNKENKPSTSRYRQSINDLFDLKTQETYLNIFENYHKFLSNMLITCSNICIKDFHHIKLNYKEEICVNNCQKKYFTAYAVGENYIKSVANKSKNADLFSDITHVDLIDNTKI